VQDDILLCSLRVCVLVLIKADRRCIGEIGVRALDFFRRAVDNKHDLVSLDFLFILESDEPGRDRS
jgi:hypothetical protein